MWGDVGVTVPARCLDCVSVSVQLPYLTPHASLRKERAETPPAAPVTLDNTG